MVLDEQPRYEQVTWYCTCPVTDVACDCCVIQTELCAFHVRSRWSQHRCISNEFNVRWHRLSESSGSVGLQLCSYVFMYFCHFVLFFTVDKIHVRLQCGFCMLQYSLLTVSLSAWMLMLFSYTQCPRKKISHCYFWYYFVIFRDIFYSFLTILSDMQQNMTGQTLGMLRDLILARSGQNHCSTFSLTLTTFSIPASMMTTGYQDVGCGQMEKFFKVLIIYFSVVCCGPHDNPLWAGLSAPLVYCVQCVWF